MTRAPLALALGLLIATPAAAQVASPGTSAPSTAAELDDFIDACGDEARGWYLERVALSTRGAAAEREVVMSYMMLGLGARSVAEAEQQIQLAVTREREGVGKLDKHDAKLLVLHKCIMARRAQQIRAAGDGRP